MIKDSKQLDDHNTLMSATMERLKDIFSDCMVFVVPETTETWTLAVISRLGVFSRHLEVANSVHMKKDLDQWIDTVKQQLLTPPSA